jgi:hypothetical protein
MFVEREANPKFLMKLSIQLHLADLSLSILFQYLVYSVSKELDRPFTTGFTRLIYSPEPGGVRVRLQLETL